MKRFFYSFLTLLAAVVLLASCSKEKDGTACLKLIPGDAAMVVRIDLKQVGDNIGYDKQAKDKLKNLLAQAVDDKEMRERLETIIDSPAEMGISTDLPVYFYVAPNMSNLAGLVGTIADKDKLTDLIESGGEVEFDETDGVSYFAAGQAALFVADDWFLVGMSGDDPESMAKDLKEAVDGDKTPIMDNDDFKALMEKKGMTQALISGRGLNAFLNKAAMFGADVQEIKAAVANALPGDLKDVSLLFDGSFANGVSESTGELLTYSKAWENAVKDFDAMLGKVTPAVAQYCSADGITMLANVDGQKLLALIESVARKFGADTSDRDFDMVRQVLSTVSGDMGAGIRVISSDEAEVAAYVSTKDASLVNLIAQTQNGDDLRQNGTDDYTLVERSYDWDFNTGDMVPVGIRNYLNFGYRQGYTYITYGKNQTTQPFRTAGPSMPSNRVKGKGFYGYVNFAGLVNAIDDSSMENVAAKAILRLLDFAEFCYEGNGKVASRSEMADKKISIANLYIDILVGAVNGSSNIEPYGADDEVFDDIDFDSLDDDDDVAEEVFDDDMYDE